MTRRDSAGIHIVEPTATAWTDQDQWIVERSYFAQIGVLEGNTPQEFSYIDDGTIADDGTVALVDGHLGEVRLFDAAGEHLMTFGGKGDGPGEFRPAASAPGMAVGFGSADTLIVSDGRRLSWFALDGSLLRDLDVGVEIRDPKLQASYEWQIGADGSILFIGSIPGGRRAGQNLVYLARSIAGELVFTTIADYQLEPSVPIQPSGGAPRTRLQRPFRPIGPAAVLKTNPLRVFVADPVRWEIRVHEPNGSIESVIRLPLRRAPVTPTWIANAREQLQRRRQDHPLLQELLREYDQLGHPDSVPAIVRMHWDATGYLWVEHYVPSFLAGKVDQRFEVLRHNGEWLGQVTVGPDVRSILRIHDGRILTTYVDDVGVHYARVYVITGQGRRGPDR